jgi:hypothetical protein
MKNDHTHQSNSSYPESSRSKKERERKKKYEKMKIECERMLYYHVASFPYQLCNHNRAKEKKRLKKIF